MLQTVEAIYDPQKGLAFLETVNISVPIKVLVTFVESHQLIASPKGSALALLAALKTHPLSKTIQMSDADIEAQVQEISQSWESS
jgi:hypothetical protein